MRVASSTWPIVLFILCAPVWQRSSRFEPDAQPGLRGESLRVVERRRPARVGREELPPALFERRVGARRRVRALELVERGDERLGDEAPAVRAVRRSRAVGALRGACRAEDYTEALHATACDLRMRSARARG